VRNIHAAFQAKMAEKPHGYCAKPYFEAILDRSSRNKRTAGFERCKLHRKSGFAANKQFGTP
jgi:hypothetical protein